jgi:predicted amidophosphoribosyltransferase
VRAPAAVAGRRVLLIDDVYTTGATVAECTRTLARAGAKEVDVLTLARVVRAGEPF